MQRFPGIGFKEGSMGRRAWVQGSHLDVWEIVQQVASYGGVEQICKDTHLVPRQAQLALAYYDAYPDEIDRMIEENQISLEEARKRYPGLVIEELPIS